MQRTFMNFLPYKTSDEIAEISDVKFSSDNYITLPFEQHNRFNRTCIGRGASW